MTARAKLISRLALQESSEGECRAPSTSLQTVRSRTAGDPMFLRQLRWLAPLEDADMASDKTSRRWTSGGVLTLGGGVLDCWAKMQKSVAQSSW